MILTVKPSGVPAGAYNLRFEGGERSVHEEYGQRVQLKFRVVGGPHDGTETSRFCSLKFGQKAGLPKLLAGLAGRKLGIGESINLNDYVGRIYIGMVAETESGATRVESIVPSQQDEPTPF